MHPWPNRKAWLALVYDQNVYSQTQYNNRIYESRSPWSSEDMERCCISFSAFQPYREQCSLSIFTTTCMKSFLNHDRRTGYVLVPVKASMAAFSAKVLWGPRSNDSWSPLDFAFKNIGELKNIRFPFAARRVVCASWYPEIGTQRTEIRSMLGVAMN